MATFKITADKDNIRKFNLLGDSDSVAVIHFIFGKLNQQLESGTILHMKIVDNKSVFEYSNKI